MTEQPATSPSATVRDELHCQTPLSLSPADFNTLFGVGDRTYCSIKFGVERDFGIQKFRHRAVPLRLVRHARKIVLAEVGHLGT